ncbi:MULTISPECIES: DNA mismatch endonuclease Vsr [unclassified Methylobacterium]|uniref:very short patch repair endonuclease n=2 Tax=unclassified Methylobacterium TaxID=2615210 RepID=UPI002ACE9801|nr:DNA mismatch endonuclease Vsr [Methylobacterium sp. 4-46]
MDRASRLIILLFRQEKGRAVADFLDPAGRSKRMSRIRSRDTKPELLLRRSLHALGLRYRLGGAGLPGKPDLVFPRYRTVIFVHGCFWHRHSGCRVATTPKSNTAFWTHKFERNVARDAEAARRLAALGWQVLVAWECEIVTKSRLGATAQRLAHKIWHGTRSS